VGQKSKTQIVLKKENMALDRNTDVGALLRSLISGQVGGLGPYARSVLGGGALLLFVLLFIVFVALPASERNDEMLGKARTLEDLNTESAALRKQLARLEADAKTQQVAFDAAVARFSDDESMAYAKVAQLAAHHGLVVSGLVSDSEKPVYPLGVKLPEAGAPQDAMPAALFNKVSFKLELRGEFLGYLNFHRELAALERFAGIESLSINTSPELGGNKVLIKAGLVVLKRISTKKLQPSSSLLQRSPPHIVQLRTALWQPQASSAAWLRIAEPKGDLVLVQSSPAPTGPFSGSGSTARIRDPFAPAGATPAAATAGNPPVDQPLFQTVGVMIGGKVSTAIVQSDAGPVTVVKVGDRLGPEGLEIVKLTEHGVVVRSKKKLLTLPMKLTGSFPEAKPAGPTTTPATKP
jgi:hypothetical protein